MVSQGYIQHMNNVAALEQIIDSRDLSLEDVITELEERYAQHEHYDPEEEDYDEGRGPGWFERFDDLPYDLLSDYVDELVEGKED